jgi:branched-chain amino acid transport system ATP-binding protein
VAGAVTRLPDLDEARARARTCLGFVDLADREHLPARALSTGQRKRLELARALATSPRLLLMDEVTGGVDQRMIPALVALVRRLRDDEGVTVVLIEHNMRVVMDLCDRIVALHLGRVLAAGTPDEVTRHPDVVRAYLGDATA